jgi:serine/threonine protein kinase
MEMLEIIFACIQVVIASLLYVTTSFLTAVNHHFTLHSCQLHQVSIGLAYLHDSSVLHGDLKAVFLYLLYLSASAF